MRYDPEMVKRWLESILQNVVASVLIALVPAAGITYLAKVGSQWTSPLLLGAMAAALSSLTALLIRRQLVLPTKSVTASTHNIEGLSLAWLGNFRVGIKNEPTPEAFFRFVLTMDGGTQMLIGRPRNEFNNYLIIRHDVTPSETEQQTIASLPPGEGARLICSIRLELSRFRVGFTPIGVPLTQFGIFKRVPINEALTEHSLIAAVEDVEAAVLAVNNIYAMSIPIASVPTRTSR